MTQSDGLAPDLAKRMRLANGRYSRRNFGRPRIRRSTRGAHAVEAGRRSSLRRSSFRGETRNWSRRRFLTPASVRPRLAGRAAVRREYEKEKVEGRERKPGRLVMAVTPVGGTMRGEKQREREKGTEREEEHGPDKAREV